MTFITYFIATQLSPFRISNLFLSSCLSYYNWYKTPSILLKFTCTNPSSQGTNNVLKSRNTRLHPVNSSVIFTLVGSSVPVAPALQEQLQ